MFFATSKLKLTDIYTNSSFLYHIKKPDHLEALAGLAARWWHWGSSLFQCFCYVVFSQFPFTLMLVTLAHKMTARAPGFTLTLKTQKEETRSFSIMRLIHFLISEGNLSKFPCRHLPFNGPEFWNCGHLCGQGRLAKSVTGPRGRNCCDELTSHSHYLSPWLKENPDFPEIKIFPPWLLTTRRKGKMGSCLGSKQ